jgi:hypothetical protein
MRGAPFGIDNHISNPNIPGASSWISTKGDGTGGHFHGDFGSFEVSSGVSDRAENLNRI